MAAIREFIRKSRLEVSEENIKRIHGALKYFVHETERDTKVLRERIGMLEAHTWRGRFRALVAWLNKK